MQIVAGQEAAQDAASSGSLRLQNELTWPPDMFLLNLRLGVPAETHAAPSYALMTLHRRASVCAAGDCADKVDVQRLVQEVGAKTVEVGERRRIGG